MRALVLSLLVISTLTLMGCKNENSGNATISAEINWSGDVSNINMASFGIQSSEILQHSIYKLSVGEGTISWKSAGVEHSKTIFINDSGIEDAEHDMECEQDGNYDGDNEACVFSFSFSGNTLSISKL